MAASTSRRRSLAGMLAVLVVPVVGLAAAQPVEAEVGGETITELDVDRRIADNKRSNALRKKIDNAGNQPTSREEVIEQLREENRILQEASRLGADLTDARIDRLTDDMAVRMKLTSPQLRDGLMGQGVDLGVFRHRIRVDLARQALRPHP
jgi:parvulin-like peptidyl-prolyl isomerase